MDWSEEEGVQLKFWSYQDLGDRETGTQFLDSLVDLGLAPNRFGEEDPAARVLTSASKTGLLELWSNRPNQMTVEGDRPEFQAILHLNPSMAEPPHSVSILLRAKYFDSPKNISRFLEFALKLYSIVKPVQGDVGHMLDRRNKTVVETFTRMGDRTVRSERHIPFKPTKGLSGVYWANFFGPTYVEFFSRQRLRSAPAFSKKMLPDGGCLILTSNSPLDYALPQTKSLERELVQYLGRDAIFDKNDPDRVLRTPFRSRGDLRKTQEARPQPLSQFERTESIRQCPECGEMTNVAEISRDPVNHLVGFRCLRCGALFAIHVSLLGQG